MQNEEVENPKTAWFERFMKLVWKIREIYRVKVHKMRCATCQVGTKKS
jgi:hypothetical protein